MFAAIGGKQSKVLRRPAGRLAVPRRRAALRPSRLSPAGDANAGPPPVVGPAFALGPLRAAARPRCAPAGRGPPWWSGRARRRFPCRWPSPCASSRRPGRAALRASAGAARAGRSRSRLSRCAGRPRSCCAAPGFAPPRLLSALRSGSGGPGAAASPPLFARGPPSLGVAVLGVVRCASWVSPIPLPSPALRAGGGAGLRIRCGGVSGPSGQISDVKSEITVDKGPKLCYSVIAGLPANAPFTTKEARTHRARASFPET